MRSEAKREALSRLVAEVQRSVPAGKQPVFGEGELDAVLAVVGEAPGREEEAQGRPFVGRAGRLLDRLFLAASLQRGELWVTNVVKWRPTRTAGGRERTVIPRRDEVAASVRWLLAELAIVKPQLVLCLGNLAARTLVARDFNLRAEHG
ncbi:MAG: uracil-DNA glycosylase [Chloroflexi bacterium]|nr:uracil-DNA glycosylase [Chloroflexota bacterium]